MESTHRVTVTLHMSFTHVSSLNWGYQFSMSLDANASKEVAIRRGSIFTTYTQESAALPSLVFFLIR